MVFSTSSAETTGAAMGRRSCLDARPGQARERPSARRGKRVVLVDADLGGANLHTTLGIDLPRRTLSDFIERKVQRIEDVVTPTGIPNLGLVSGALDHLDAANPKYAQKMRFLRH